MTEVDIQEPENKTVESKSGFIRQQYKTGKKPASFLSQLNVNVEEPNAMVNLVRELSEINENLPMKARLNRNQILSLSKAYWYAMRYSVQTLIDYCDSMLVLTVSEGGKGRQELTQLSNAIAHETEVKAKSSDIKL